MSCVNQWQPCSPLPLSSVCVWPSRVPPGILFTDKLYSPVCIANQPILSQCDYLSCNDIPRSEALEDHPKPRHQSSMLFVPCIMHERGILVFTSGHFFDLGDLVFLNIAACSPFQVSP